MKRNQRNPEQPNHPLLADENYRRFLAWRANDDYFSVSLKLAYIDLADDDLIAGILLAQILYWFSPDKHGRPRARVKKGDRYWLAKRRTDWLGQCRITENQYDRAIQVLVKRGLVTVELHRFSGTPMPHIWVNWETLVTELAKIPPQAPANGNSTETKVEKPLHGLVNPDFEQKSKSITKELLSKTSSEETNNTVGSVSHLREENKDHSPTPQESTAELPIPPCSQEEKDALVKEFLAKWRERFPGRPATDVDVQAAQELISLGVHGYARGSVVRMFIDEAAKQGFTSVKAMLDRYGRHLEERKRVYQLTEMEPGNQNPRGDKFVALLTAWGCWFFKVNQRRYHFSEADLLAATDFVENDPEIKVADIINTADCAWEDAEKPKPQKGFDKHFYSRKAGKLSGLLKFYEEIVREVHA